MKDASVKRRSLGKLGILTAAAIILPLTATIVPAVGAQNEPALAAAEGSKTEVVKKLVKIIKIHTGDKDVHVVGGDDKKVIRKIVRDGKSIIIHGDHKFSDAELAKITADAEASTADVEKWLEHSDKMRGNANDARHSADDARGHADAMRIHAVAMAANYIPEIDISEITRNCRSGQPVTTNVEGFDGTGKSRIRIVMCGKGQSKVAKREALQGLREARSEIASEKDMPEGVRKDVVEKLEKQIRKLETETDEAG